LYEVRQSGGTGSVTFSGNGTSRIATGTGVGNVAIEIRRLGDSLYEDSDWMGVGGLTVTKLSQSSLSGVLSLTSIRYGAFTTLTLSGGSGSGLYEVKQSGGTGSVTFSGNGTSRKITGTGVGNATIEIRRLGDSLHEDSDWMGVGTLGVVKASQSSFTTVFGTKTIRQGSTTTLTLSGGSGSGSYEVRQTSGPGAVTFSGNGTLWTILGTGVGNATVEMRRLGDAFYGEAGWRVIGVMSVTKKLQDQEVTGGWSSQTLEFGGSTTLTLSGGSGSGLYEVRQSGGTGSVTFSGNGTSQIATGTGVGNATIEIRRLGDSLYEDSDWMGVGGLTVTKTQQSSLSAVFAKIIRYGSGATLTLSGGSGSGLYEVRQSGGTGSVTFSGSGTARRIAGTGIGTAAIEIRRLGDETYIGTDWSTVGGVSVIKKAQNKVMGVWSSPTVAVTSMETLTLSGGSGSGLYEVRQSGGTGSVTFSGNGTSRIATGAGVGNVAVEVRRLGDFLHDDSVWQLVEGIEVGSEQAVVSGVLESTSIRKASATVVTGFGGSGSGAYEFREVNQDLVDMTVQSSDSYKVVGKALGTTKLEVRREGDRYYKGSQWYTVGDLVIDSKKLVTITGGGSDIVYLNRVGVSGQLPNTSGIHAKAQGPAGEVVAGTFTYEPAAGTILDVGNHTIKVRFKPTSVEYGEQVGSISVSIVPRPLHVGLHPHYYTSGPPWRKTYGEERATTFFPQNHGQHAPPNGTVASVTHPWILPDVIESAEVDWSGGHLATADVGSYPFKMIDVKFKVGKKSNYSITYDPEQTMPLLPLMVTVGFNSNRFYDANTILYGKGANLQVDDYKDICHSKMMNGDTITSISVTMGEFCDPWYWGVGMIEGYEACQYGGFFSMGRYGPTKLDAAECAAAGYSLSDNMYKFVPIVGYPGCIVMIQGTQKGSYNPKNYIIRYWPATARYYVSRPLNKDSSITPSVKWVATVNGPGKPACVGSSYWGIPKEGGLTHGLSAGFYHPLGGGYLDTWEPRNRYNEGVVRYSVSDVSAWQVKVTATFTPIRPVAYKPVTSEVVVDWYLESQAPLKGFLKSSSVGYGATTTLTLSGGSGSGLYEVRQSGGTGSVTFSGNGTSRIATGTGVGNVAIEIRRLGDSSYEDSPWMEVGILEVVKGTQSYISYSFSSTLSHNSGAVVLASHPGIMCGDTARLNISGGSGSGAYEVTVSNFVSLPATKNIVNISGSGAERDLSGIEPGTINVFIRRLGDANYKDSEEKWTYFSVIKRKNESPTGVFSPLTFNWRTENSTLTLSGGLGTGAYEVSQVKPWYIKEDENGNAYHSIRTYHDVLPGHPCFLHFSGTGNSRVVTGTGVCNPLVQIRRLGDSFHEDSEWVTLDPLNIIGLDFPTLPTESISQEALIVPRPPQPHLPPQPLPIRYAAYPWYDGSWVRFHLSKYERSDGHTFITYYNADGTVKVPEFEVGTHCRPLHLEPNRFDVRMNSGDYFEIRHQLDFYIKPRNNVRYYAKAYVNLFKEK